MRLRANLVLALVVILAAVQMFASASGGPRIDDATTAAAQPNMPSSRSVAAQDNDNEDEDNEDGDNDDGDNEDGDNDSDNEDSDNDDGDNEDSDNDDGDNEDSDESDNDNDGSDDADEDLENVEIEEDEPTPDAATTTSGDDSFAISTPSPATPETSWSQMPPGMPAAPPSPSPSPSPVPFMETRVVTTGADLWVALPGDRVGVQVFASTPPGITLTVRLVEPLAYPPAPGIRAGDLIFLVDAVDADGYTLATMPAEARLTIRYGDMDVFGLDESFLTLSRLDAATSTWFSVPNVVIDPVSNYLETPLMETGVYVLSVP